MSGPGDGYVNRLDCELEKSFWNVDEMDCSDTIKVEMLYLRTWNVTKWTWICKNVNYLWCLLIWSFETEHLCHSLIINPTYVRVSKLVSEPPPTFYILGPWITSCGTKRAEARGWAAGLNCISVLARLVGCRAGLNMTRGRRLAPVVDSWLNVTDDRCGTHFSRQNDSRQSTK